MMSKLRTGIQCLVAPNWLLIRSRLVATQLGPALRPASTRGRLRGAVQHAPLDDVFVPAWLVLAVPAAAVGLLAGRIDGAGVILAALLAFPVGHLAGWLVGERVTSFAGETALVRGDDRCGLWHALRVHTVLGWVGTVLLMAAMIGLQ